MVSESPADFSAQVLNWYAARGRKDLPWQINQDPYRIWVSEIMLQQTQVQTVIPYYQRFMAEFPRVKSLADASLDEVLALWSGLGYYSRARNLHQAARMIEQQFQGQFPANLQLLQTLPGIGRSTAAAIASLAFNLPTPILDGNVKRVLCRYFMIEGWPEQSRVKARLWEIAERLMPPADCAHYTQAMMDLGALCCTKSKPQCDLCPLSSGCKAYQSQQTGLFPSPKPRKVIPVKRQAFLLVINPEDKILLEKNPDQGLWGGLWVLPRMEAYHCPEAYLSEHYALAAQKPSLLTRFKHRFTHFELEIEAYTLESLGNASLNWFPAEEALQIGLPKPVRHLIETWRHQFRRDSTT